MTISTCKLLNDPVGLGNTVGVIATTNTGKILHIPFDEGNIDYQEYLAWVAEGNTAEAAD